MYRPVISERLSGEVGLEDGQGSGDDGEEGTHRGEGCCMSRRRTSTRGRCAGRGRDPPAGVEQRGTGGGRSLA